MKGSACFYSRASTAGALMGILGILARTIQAPYSTLRATSP